MVWIWKLQKIFSTKSQTYRETHSWSSCCVYLVEATLRKLLLYSCIKTKIQSYLLLITQSELQSWTKLICFQDMSKDRSLKFQYNESVTLWCNCIYLHYSFTKGKGLLWLLLRCRPDYCPYIWHYSRLYPFKFTEFWNNVEHTQKHLMSV